MSRPLRIEYPGAWYHVMNRGRRGEQIFSVSKDYSLFIDLLKEAVELWDIRISAYCLMTNHYHLLIQTPSGNLSRSMRHINGVYTQRYNRTHRLDGQLFRGRFKSILVEENRYLLALLRYIHRNPIRAGMAEALDKYPWSSHKGYCSSATRWEWLHKGFILSMLSSNIRKSQKAYRDFMEEDDSDLIKKLLHANKLPSIMGGEDFINWAKETFFDRKKHHQVPESIQLAPGLNEIKAAVCSHYGCQAKDLLQSKRGVINEPRNVAIYLSRMLRKDGLLNISEAFNMRGYSSAGSAIERVRKRMIKDRLLQRRIEEIKQRLTSNIDQEPNGDLTL